MFSDYIVFWRTHFQQPVMTEAEWKQYFYAEDEQKQRKMLGRIRSLLRF